MKKRCFPLLFLLIGAFCVLFSSVLSAQTLDSPLSYEGGADIHLYKSDSVMTENTILDSGWKTRDADSVSTGFYMAYSPYLSILYLPFVYAPVSWFETDVTLPFMYKLLINSSSEREKTGFGDIKLGLNFCLVPLDNAVINFRVKITFPTGDASARDRDLLIPMGYGMFTFSGLWSVSSMYIGNKKFGIRFFANFGTVGYFKTQIEPDNTVRHYIDNSYAISTLGGFEMKIINRVYLQGKMSYAYLPERRFKTETMSTNTTTHWTGLNDSLHAMDVIIALKFDFIPDFSGNVMTVIPVYEEQDTSIKHPKERRWKIFLSLEKSFSLSKKGKSKDSSYRSASDTEKTRESSYKNNSSNIEKTREKEKDKEKDEEDEDQPKKKKKKRGLLY